MKKKLNLFGKPWRGLPSHAVRQGRVGRGCAWLIVSALIGCGGEAGLDASDELAGVEGDYAGLEPIRFDEARGEESILSFEELLKTPYEELTVADIDRLKLMSAEISPAAYRALYPDSELESLPEPGQDAWPDFEAATFQTAQGQQLTAGQWNTVQVPAGRCSNGSPYKIFVKPAADPVQRASGEVIAYFEPGGACWDYESCSGRLGFRGASNPNGIPDNFMSLADYLNPFASGGSINSVISPLLSDIALLGVSSDRVATDSWTQVFFPYCTGDVFAGDTIATYSDPDGLAPDLTFYHWGARNVDAAIAELNTILSTPSKLMATGCSAGGAGALASYHALRQGLNPQSGVLLNDSGPVFPATMGDPSYPLHQEIRSAWNGDGRIDQIAAASGLNIRSDFGLINDALAQLYPNDRLATTLFRQDYIYSVYSYERFYGLDEQSSRDERTIRTFWNRDVDALIRQHNRYANFYYHVPFYRSFLDSHCTTTLNWSGTQIRSTGYFVNDFINDLLDPTTTPRNSDEGFHFGDYWTFNIVTYLGTLIVNKG